ncbi:SLATT domain-containing protein [Streptomyces sp. XD-27]|uniref:SLATT domain-containing protein n=1 Tax=Streptomyces sp. XD-27 TaxID=3062779 RepID=UPI0026F42F2F|nr:SLATT domain-containing protein [Streptomyces sp. XD-27]WKX71230.1 SLATT domain-containing protein [Streptomyces sp. XD-27]
MSQPEMQPEGPLEPPRQGRGRKQGDLLGRPFPLGDWAEPAERLDELFRWAENDALRVAEWYLADRVWKRRTAFALRVGTGVAAVAGGTLPLLDLNGLVAEGAGWGCLALLLAVACVACDRFFGLTSGWMRDVATAQAVLRRLEALRFDWAMESVREVLGPAEGTASEAADRCLAVLRRFCEDVSGLVRAETVGWMAEFGSGSAPLYAQALTMGGARVDGEAPGGRFPPPPGTRPNMPRQRPPGPTR